MSKVYFCILTLAFVTLLSLLSITSSPTAFRKDKTYQQGEIAAPAYTIRETSVFSSPRPDTPEYNAFLKQCKRTGQFKSCGYKLKGQPNFNLECCRAESCVVETNGEGEWRNRCPKNTLVKIKYLVIQKEKLVLDTPFVDSDEWKGFVAACTRESGTKACGWSQHSEKDYHIQCCRSKSCQEGKDFFTGKKIVGQYYWYGNTAITYRWDNFCPEGTAFSLKYEY